MILESLSLRNFRNISRFDWVPHPRANLFLGSNAQGKTNLLESIYLLGTTKPLRHGSHEEQIAFGEDFAVVKGTVHREKPGMQRDLEVQLKREGVKQVKLNGKRLAPFSKIFGELSVVLFVPEDLQMVKAGPATRRFFLDLEISQASPDYLHALQQYQRVLKQRNAALRMLRDGASADTVEVYDEPLVAAGSQVILQRLKALEELGPQAARVQERVSQGKEKLSLHYESSLAENVDEELPGDEGQLQQIYRQRLAQVRDQETRRWTTLAGPHRDDMAIHINDRQARTYASQGQQRTAALALKLAEVHFLKARLGENPLLLLDDVLSELDLTRQRELLGLLDEQVQTIVTSTHTEDLPFKPGQVMQVEEGSITPMEKQ